jgi:hypothetical protein
MVARGFSLSGLAAAHCGWHKWPYVQLGRHISGVVGLPVLVCAASLEVWAQGLGGSCKQPPLSTDMTAYPHMRHLSTLCLLGGG